MASTVVERLRPMAPVIAVALLAGAVIALSPLLVGAMAADRSVTVVDLQGYPNVNDGLLGGELGKAGDPSDILIIIPPADHIPEAPDFDCTNEVLPKSCPVLHDFPRRIVATDKDALTTTLVALYRTSSDDEDHNVYVRSGRRSLSDSVAWGAAWKVGLVMTVAAAAAVFVALRRRPRVLPAYTEAAAPAPAPKPRPAPRQAPPIVAGSMPADAMPPPGTPVIARTHFGPHGGYVDAGGVILWARLIDPGGGGVRPGQAMTVVGPARAHDALVVSPAVTEEARP